MYTIVIIIKPMAVLQCKKTKLTQYSHLLKRYMLATVDVRAASCLPQLIAKARSDTNNNNRTEFWQHKEALHFTSRVVQLASYHADDNK